MSKKSDTKSEPGKRRLDAWITIALLALVLILPSAAQLIGVGASSGENRSLAPFPAMSRLKEIKDLPRLADSYVNDRFGLRQQLVHLNSVLRFKLGLSSTKDVVIGKDNWLFYAHDKILDQHTGADIFQQDELDRWIRQMEANRDWLAQRGIAFAIVIAPEKNTIYPEMLPDYPRRPSTATRLDQLAERMKSSTLEFLDPRRELLAAKAKGEKVYFEGDTHWTQRGAFIVYSLLMERLRKRFPNLSVKTERDYSISVAPAPAADLARLLDMESDFLFPVEKFEIRGPSHETQNPSITYRQGWPWRVTEMHTDLAGKPRLMVMGDSYTDYVLGPGFLYETFRDSVWTNHHLGNFNFALVRETKPDLVIFEMAERFLKVPVGKPIGAD